MKLQKMFGIWEGLTLGEMLAEWVRRGEKPPRITERELLFANYEDEFYTGTAFVLYERRGKLYEVNGSHCSCYGLEDQWNPEKTTWAALNMREWRYVTEEGRTALKKLIASRLES